MEDEQILAMIRGALIDADPAGAEAHQHASFESSIESLGWDSIMLVNAIGIVEDKFDVRFRPADIFALETISELVTLVKDELYAARVRADPGR